MIYTFLFTGNHDVPKIQRACSGPGGIMVCTSVCHPQHPPPPEKNVSFCRDLLVIKFSDLIVIFTCDMVILIVNINLKKCTSLAILGLILQIKTFYIYQATFLGLTF